MREAPSGRSSKVSIAPYILSPYHELRELDSQMGVASKRVQLPQMKLGMLSSLHHWEIDGLQIFQQCLSLAATSPANMIQLLPSLNPRQFAQPLSQVEAHR